MTWPQVVILGARVVPPFSTGGVDVTVPALVRLGPVVGDTAGMSGPSHAADPSASDRATARSRPVPLCHPAGAPTVSRVARPAATWAPCPVRDGVAILGPGVLDDAVETSRVTKGG